MSSSPSSHVDLGPSQEFSSQPAQHPRIMSQYHQWPTYELHWGSSDIGTTSHYYILSPAWMTPSSIPSTEHLTPQGHQEMHKSSPKSIKHNEIGLFNLPTNTHQAQMPYHAGHDADARGVKWVFKSINPTQYNDPIGRGKRYKRQSARMRRADVAGIARAGASVQASATVRAQMQWAVSVTEQAKGDHEAS
ncbi:hypothetical protein MA16_Dca012873 [Dendrobium catenatum]|uniref:Uncharacterized protein n=1 Tax=Dendrobium catenatum TaxID=906689 RepID=A0A2I0VXS4_9ASPA|nr:hypothetical protein MA16_Dca012873 [Dendrobium catenatum]